MIKMWLDDNRPAPHGWARVKTVDEAKNLLLSERVGQASLDHDLGACDECRNGMTDNDWLDKHHWQQMPNCSHFGTGYDLVCWLEDPENEKYRPKVKPTVHSANPVGRKRMQEVLDRIYS